MAGGFDEAAIARCVSAMVPCESACESGGAAAARTTAGEGDDEGFGEPAFVYAGAGAGGGLAEREDPAFPAACPLTKLLLVRATAAIWQNCLPHLRGCPTGAGPETVPRTSFVELGTSTDGIPDDTAHLNCRKCEGGNIYA